MNPRHARREPPPQDRPLDACLKFLSSAWTVRILWFLRCGPRRFGDLRRDLGAISAKVLSQRLRSMQAHGLVNRGTLPASPQIEYRLTALGHEFEPVLDAMTRVAARLARR
jgi:DNA-binding HxlR family transcriptional regulator